MKHEWKLTLAKAMLDSALNPESGLLLPAVAVVWALCEAGALQVF